MTRTLGKVLRFGQEITGEVPVKLKIELGMCSGDLHMDSEAASEVDVGPCVLRLNDGREIPIIISGMCGRRVYFHAEVSVTDAMLRDAALAGGH